MTAATLCAAAMIANQVASKATRDALFLSSFDVTSLPAMLVSAAVLSLIVVWPISRAMTAVGPARLVPAAFLGSAALLLLQWGIVLASPAVASVVLYLHIALLGPALISGFWSIVNERFDPRTARKQITRIGLGATAGGVMGGLLAARVAALAGVATMFPVLAALHCLCAVATRPLRRPAHGPGGEIPESEASARSGLQVLRRVPYLRDLAALVLLSTAGTALLDYVFKAGAVAHYSRGPELMRFFALFYAGLGLATFLVQAALSQRSLETLGLARTAASLPAAVVLGGAGALFLPGLASAVIVRAADSVFRSSLFRAGYELFYTPIALRDKRATKPIIDVGCDRLGDILGGGLVAGAVFLLPLGVRWALLPLAMGLALVCLAITARLHRGYVATLQQRLRERAVEVNLQHVHDSTTRSVIMLTVGSLDLKEIARQSAERAAARPDPDHRPEAGADDPCGRWRDDLASGDPGRLVHRLSAETIPPEMVPRLVPLLAWDEVTAEVARALCEVAPEHVDALVAALLDPNEEFAVRRRVPRVLGTVVSATAFEGLFEGLGDPRFEVRFQCGRGLVRLAARDPGLAIGSDRVTAAVLREVKVERRMWETRRLLDDAGGAEESEFVDDVLQDRVDRSLEHIFSLISLMLDRRSLRLAFRGLHTDDQTLRGTALEYLDSALPPEIRDALWPFLEHDETRRRRESRRPRDEILAELMRSYKSIEANLMERSGGATGAGEKKR